MRVLFVGDVMGRPGRRALGSLLGALRVQYGLDFVVANGENAAGGLGITQDTARELFDAGVDVITMGNHSFAKKDAVALYETEPRILRPANYPPGVPGRGVGIFETPRGEKIAVINLLGRVFMDPVDCPFRAADAALSEVSSDAHAIIVDFHAEATSEKQALGWYLDGRVSAVIGTHTHVQTSDERILPAGSGYVTDVGMTGVLDSVLGLDRKLVIERFLTGLPNRFSVAEGAAVVQGVLVEIDLETRSACSIERLCVPEPNPLEADLPGDSGEGV
ncbi:MAG: TIGR00282 family metallophosphoesterase [Armatimonadota bacterium]|nr:TIGR00282 family metallophosphoesterase [Armatimonadota bacterium]